jgi:hypothetical protein
VPIEPSNQAHAGIGVGKLFVGRAIETEAYVQEALRVSPRDEGAPRWMCYAGLAKLHLGADAEATDWLRRSLNTNPNYHIAHILCAVAYHNNSFSRSN